MEARFFQKDIETMRRPDIEALQLERLRRMVDYCYNNVPFYHERLGAAGITSGDKIKVLSDVQYIPFTTKDDIRDNYPFGMLAVPMKDIVRIHAEAFARNAASRRVLEKAGFALEGTLRRSVYKNGEMLDSCIYALVREEAP